MSSNVVKEYKKINSIKTPKKDSGEDNRRALTPEEEEKGLKILANPIQRMLFWTGLKYGLRRSEYINLKLDDVDLEYRILIIRQSKGNKTRRIPILKNHVPIWQQWFKTREAYSTADHDYVFFTDRGKAGKRSLERYFNKICESIRGKKYGDIPEKDRITSHTLRYTFAGNCWRNRMDLLVLSKILGHNSLKTTQRYLRITEKETLDNYEKQASKFM
ncbi:MAG: tyrosine-type recombinase/integrase [Candidatus Hodarchaeales archaeon]|jgi:integrase/recombinase XerD